MVDNQPAAPPRQGKDIAELHAVPCLNGFPAIRKIARNIPVLAMGFQHQVDADEQGSSHNPCL